MFFLTAKITPLEIQGVKFDTICLNSIIFITPGKYILGYIYQKRKVKITGDKYHLGPSEPYGSAKLF